MRILYTASTIRLVKEKAHFLEFARALQEVGNEMLLLLTNYGEKADNIGIRVAFIPTLWRTHFAYWIAEFLRLFYLPFWIMRFRPQVILSRKEVFDLAPPLWARLLRVPYVPIVHGIIEEELRLHRYPQWFIGLVTTLESFNYKTAARVFCVTEGIKRWISRRFGMAPEKLIVMPNGVNTYLFRPLNKDECRQKLGLATNSFIITFVGYFYSWQGLDTLIRAARIIKDKGYKVQYLLVGSGSKELSLRQLVQKESLEEDVLFTGWAEYERTPIYIGASDICYVSKTGFSSGFSPLKLYQYLACGKPVIASKSDGLREVISESGSGFLFEPGNTEDLARVIDIRTKQAVSLEVTNEVTADGEKLKPLVKRAQRRVKVKRALGDRGYDTHDNFKFLAACGIEAGIKVREDSNPNCGGQREEVVRAYLKDPPGWKERMGYGQRWMAESAASTF